MKGLEELKTNGVPNRIYKKIRTKLVGCVDDSEYLAKLYSLRLAFKNIMSTPNDQKWYDNMNKWNIDEVAF